MSSFAERQRALLTEISGAFVRNIESSSSKLNFIGLTHNNINCKTSLTETCNNCLRRFKSQSWIDDPQNNAARTYFNGG